MGNSRWFKSGARACYLAPADSQDCGLEMCQVHSALHLVFPISIWGTDLNITTKPYHHTYHRTNTYIKLSTWVYHFYHDRERERERKKERKKSKSERERERARKERECQLWSVSIRKILLTHWYVVCIDVVWVQLWFQQRQPHPAVVVWK